MRVYILCIALLYLLFSYPLLAVNIDGQTEVCEGECITYTAINGDGGPYYWSVTNGSPASGVGESMEVCWSGITGYLQVVDEADETFTNSSTIIITTVEAPAPQLLLPEYPSCYTNIDCDATVTYYPNILSASINAGAFITLVNDCYQVSPGETIILDPLANDSDSFVDTSGDCVVYSYDLLIGSFPLQDNADIHFNEGYGGISSIEYTAHEDACGLQEIEYQICLYTTELAAYCNNVMMYIDIICEDDYAASNCVKACTQSTATYSVLTDNELEWQLENIDDYEINDNELSINWEEAGLANIQITETNENNCAVTEEYCIAILESPTATFSLDATLICQGQSLNILNESTAAESYWWEFGDGNISTDFEPVFAYENPGNYNIKLIAFSECFCSDTTYLSIQVEESILPKILCTSTVCQGDTITYYSDTPCSSYGWSINDEGTIVEGGSSTDDYITIVWDGSILGKVELDLNACAEDCQLIAFADIPIISDGWLIEGETEACKDESVYVYSLPYAEGVSYDWYVYGGNIIGNNIANEISVTWATGYFSYGTVNVTYSNCYLDCSFSTSLDVDLNRPAYLISAPLACEGELVTVSSNYHYMDCDWNLTLPDGEVINDIALDIDLVEYTLDMLGTYVFEAIPVGGSWCEDVYTYSIEVLPAAEIPTSMVGSEAVCADNWAIYQAIPTEGAEIAWILGDTIAKIGDVLEVFWEGEGPFSLGLVQQILEAPYCMSDTLFYEINIVSDLSIQGETAACAGEVGTYNATLIEGVVYDWTINPSSAGSIIGSGHEIEVLWNTGASATLSLDICGQNASLTINLNDSPNPFISNNSVCEGELLSVSPSEVYDTYTWKDENGEVIGNESTIYLGSGYYELLVSNSDGCEGRSQFFIDSFPLPEVVISTPDSKGFCPPVDDRMLVAVDTENGYDYQWYLDGLPISGATNPILYTLEFGTFYVEVTDQNGCTNISNDITLYETCIGSPPPPSDEELIDELGPLCSPDGISNFDTNQIFCSSYELTNTSVNYIEGTINWYYTDINEVTYSDTSNEESFNHEFDSPGYYKLALSAYYPDANGSELTCRKTFINPIEVVAVADFEYDLACAANPVSFTDLSLFLPMYNIVEWNWNFGDPSSGAANTSSLVNPVHVYNEAGTYEVSLEIVMDEGCTEMISKTIEVLANPEVEFTYSNNTCTGNSIECTLSSLIEENSVVNWNFGDPSSGEANYATGPLAYHVYETAGTYNITVNVTDIFACSSELTQTVLIENGSVGTISLSGISPICEGETITLTASEGLSYEWSNGSTNQNLIVNSSGVYGVTITDSDGCQSTPNPVSIIVVPSPQAEIYASPVYGNGEEAEGVYYYDSYEMCEGDEVILNTLEGYEYQWSAFGSIGAEFPLTAAFNNLLSEGTYYYLVTITDSETGCSSVSPPFEIYVHSNPSPINIVSSIPEPICEGEVIVLSIEDPEEDINYQWSNGLYGTSITVNDAGTYFAMLTNQWGCTVLSNEITVHSLPDISAVPTGCHIRCNPDQICLPYYTLSLDNTLSYQWYYNDEIIPAPEGNVGELIIEEEGAYFLELTNEAGCSAISDILDITFTDATPDISGLVYNDVNQNGIWEEGEDGIENVEIFLVASGDTINSMFTDIDGEYIFDEVSIDYYQLKINLETLPDGGQLTTNASVSIYYINDCQDQGVANWGVYICPVEYFSESFSTCENTTYSFEGDELEIGSSTEYVFESEIGCDSVVVVDIVGLSNYEESHTYETCEGTTYSFDGEEIEIGSSMSFTYSSELGCDSIVVVDIVGLSSYDETYTYEVCEGTTYLYEGEDLAIGSSTPFTYVSELGCDSVVLINIEALPSYNESYTYETCEGTIYAYGGEDLEIGSSTAFTYSSELGCDSTVVISVISLPIYNESYTYEACEGTTYAYEGEDLEIGSSTPFTYMSELGCDSTVLISIVSVENYSESVTYETCAGTTYSYEGEDLAIGSETSFSYVADNGCDSIVVVSVESLTTHFDTVELLACANEEAVFDGESLAIGSMMDFSYVNEWGCDSIITVSVLEAETYLESVSLDACTGSSMFFDGEDLIAGSTTDFTYQTDLGCDSIISVSVNPFPQFDVTLSSSVSCWNLADGQIEVVDVLGEGVFEYSIDGVVYDANPVFEELSGGDYTVYVRDENACVQTFDISIEETEALSFEVEDRIIPCVESSIILELPLLSGDPSEISYLWEDGSTEASLEISEVGDYSVTITNSCELVTHTISVVREEDYIDRPFAVPNAFSPNNDGLNDYFRPIPKSGIEILSYEFQVYDRWGKRLYKSSDADKGWSGEFQGEGQMMGVYVWFYTAEILSCGEEREVFNKGNVTLIR